MSKYADTQYNHKQACQTAILDAFSSMRIYKPTHDKCIEMLNNRVYNSNHYNRLSGYYKEYLRGWIDSQWRENYHFLDYKYLWYDGNYYTSDELKAMEQDFTWERWTKNFNHVDDKIRSGYFWKDSQKKY